MIPDPSGCAAKQRRLIMQLSDLHFGEAHRFYDSDVSDRLAIHMTAELEEICRLRRVSVEHVVMVISGDLTCDGGAADFAKASTFLREVCAGTGLGHEQVFLAPGNHDVNWHASAADPAKRFDEFLNFAMDFYGEQGFRQRYPMISWNFRVGSERPAPHEVIAVLRSGDLLFVGLNSCVHESHELHYGFVGQRQLSCLKGMLREHGKGAVAKIGVVHHQLHPYPEPLAPRDTPEMYVDLSAIRDAGALEGCLQRFGFDLLLHGHKHKPQIRVHAVHSPGLPPGPADLKPIVVSGVGSAGVDSRRRDHAQANHYALLELPEAPRRSGDPFVTISWRELSENVGAEWVTTSVSTIRG